MRNVSSKFERGLAVARKFIVAGKVFTSHDIRKKVGSKTVTTQVITFLRNRDVIVVGDTIKLTATAGHPHNLYMTKKLKRNLGL